MSKNPRTAILKVLCSILGLSALLVWAPGAHAYSTWSGGCSGCHGGFTAGTYTSLANGQSWNGNLHDIHRTNLLSGDCNACHVSSGRTPVYLAQSQGGTGFSPIGCTGCHEGPGLRQHHRVAAASQCSGCHSAPEIAQAENVLRPYYFSPDAAHPNKPTDPCNGNGRENVAATAAGLDNDGNLLYDLADPACAVKAPKADAGPSQSAREGTTVTLNGSNSTGTGLTYQWTQTGTPAVVLSTPTAVTTPFTAPAVGSTGATLTFQLTVTDSAKQTASATTTVAVTDVNQAPIANAGPGQTVSSGSPVTLDGSNSADPDGAIATYAWTQVAGPVVTLSSASAAKPSFAAPAVGSPVSLGFQLTVTDNLGLASAPATVTVNVTAVAPPVADAGVNQTVAEGTQVTLDGSKSTGTTLTYRWTQTAGPSATLSDPAGISPTFTAPAVGSTGATLTFQLTVTDAARLTSSASVLVNVTDLTVNQPPVADAGMDQTAAPSATVTLDGSRSADPDGTIAAYLWSQTAGASVTLSDPTATNPSFTAPSVGGTLTFQLLVTDGGGLSSTASVTVTMPAEPPPPAADEPPAADAGLDRVVLAGATVTLDGSGSSDPEGTPLTYLWTQVAGPSATLSNASTAKATFQAPSTAGVTLTFQLTVTDAAGLTATDTVIVQVSATVNREVQLYADLPSPQVRGTTVLFTAQGQGPESSYVYRFSLRKPGRRWSVVRSYSPKTIWEWKTEEAHEGTYEIKVDMKATRSKVKSQTSKAVSYVLVDRGEIGADREEDHETDD